MVNKLLWFFLMIFVGSIVFAWEIEDINGTYVSSEEQLKHPNIHWIPFSWGRGWTFVDNSIEFDLGEQFVNIPGMGKYLFDSVDKDDEDSICLRVYFMGDKTRDDPINIKVTFIDQKTVYIVIDKWERWRNKTYSPEEKWVWYRLSGPKKN